MSISLVMIHTLKKAIFDTYFFHINIIKKLMVLETYH